MPRLNLGKTVNWVSWLMVIFGSARQWIFLRRERLGWLSILYSLAFLMLILSWSLTPVEVVRAAAFIVTDSGDSGTNTLRNAITQANASGSPSTITFNFASYPVTITLTSALPAIDGYITIQGPLTGTLAISGGNTNQVFNINYSRGLSLSNLTVVNGSATRGGGIYNQQGTLSLFNVTLSNNKANQSGGAIYNSGGSVLISNSILSSNQAYPPSNGDGGAIVNSSNGSLGTLSISNSVITGNQAYIGGAINNAGTLTITTSTIATNTAVGTPGGGAILNSGKATVASSTFSGNKANGGGAIYNINTTIFNFTITSTLTVTNSTFYNNQANGIFNGGAIYSEGDLRVGSSTFSNNRANSGGGIYQSSGTVTLKNSIVANNSATTGNGPNIGGTFASQGYNLIGDGSGSTFSSNTGDQVGSAASPIDPQLGSFQYNGGPTFTQGLLNASPALDAGNPAGCTDFSGNLLTTDQRGLPRPETVGGRCDIGAFEGINPILVSNAIDNGQGDTSGSLTYALKQTVKGSTIIFAPGLITITLTGGNNPFVVGPGVAVLGPSCANPVVIDGNGRAGDGLFLQGGATLQNLTLKGFAGRQLVLNGSNGQGKNGLKCVKIRRS